MTQQVCELVVLGMGGHAVVVIDLARAAGHRVRGCVGPGTPSFDADFCPYLGSDATIDVLNRKTTGLTVGVGAIGDSAKRRQLFDMGRAKSFAFVALAHPRASISDSARIGSGAQVMAGAIINPFASIGANAIINTGAVIEHHVTIGDHVHVAPGAILCGGARVGEGVHVGAGATVLQGVRLGPDAIVAAGAVVIRDVPAGTTVMGVPAR